MRLIQAVRRRAALQLTFRRPDAIARGDIFRNAVPELKLSERQLKELVSITGPEAEKKYGVSFTASDITDRLLPSALREAYAASRAIDSIGYYYGSKGHRTVPVDEWKE